MVNPLRQLRIAAGLSQAEVAEAVTRAGNRLSQPLLSQLESEHARPTLRMRSAIETAISSIVSGNFRRFRSMAEKLRDAEQAQ